MTVSLQEFTKLCEDTWKMREEVDELSRVQKVAANKLEDMKAKVLAYMEHYELEKQHIPGCGTLNTINRFSVKVPQGDDKLAFFEYLKGIGSFEDMATVNSNTLNSWYKEKLEAALAEGEIELKIPGIAEAKINKTLGFRKG